MLRTIGLLACIITLTACDDANEPPAVLRDMATADGTIYVLGRAEQQTTEPIVIIDSHCAGSRWVTVLHDTLTLWADGRAQRRFTLSRFRDGVKVEQRGSESSGTWREMTTPVDYFSDGPSITIGGIATESSAAADVHFRVLPDELRTLQWLGARCPVAGGADDPLRQAELVFTRRD